MPGTLATFWRSRWITSVALSERCSIDFSVTSMRPLFSVALPPSMPMNDDRPCTSGSCRMARAAACWRSAIAANDTDCGASVITWIAPVSCTGKKPFGTVR